MTEDLREREMLAVLKSARDEAFAEGWEAAVRAIMSAATNAAPDANAIKGAAWFAQYVNAPDSEPTVDRAPWGLTIRAADAALDRAGDLGTDIGTIQATARELEGHDIAESSIRTTLRKMERDGKVSKRGNRWFRVLSAPTETAEPAHQASSADPIFHNQGGQHHAAALVN